MQKLRYLDKKQHGTADYPIEYYYVDQRHPRYLMAFHWHKEWELMRVLEGSFSLTLNDAVYTLTAGDCVLICPETLHGGEPSNCRYECLVFDLYALFKKTDTVTAQLSPFYKKELQPNPLFPANDPTIASLLDPFTHQTGGTCPELDVICGIIALFSHIIGGKLYHCETAGENQWSSRIKPVLEYIDAHFCDNLSLDTLAAQAGMNSRYFCKIFSSLTHRTPMDYVNFYRTEHAAFLLEFTALPITQIAADCGFWESSYFTKVFKKYKYCTPKQYRTNVKKAKQ